jgi:CRP-like cAMP-binding protein
MIEQACSTNKNQKLSMKELHHFIARYVPDLSPAFEEDLYRVFYTKKLKKGEHLIQAGQISRTLYFVKKGMLRNYLIKNDKELTVWFFFPENFVTVFDSMILQIPGKENTIAMTPCELYAIAYEKLEMLNKVSHEWEHISRVFTIEFALQQEMRLYMFQTMNAEEKYQFLLDMSPHIIENIPSKYIASYLGISRETLSRIRGRIA